jgi:uncharacterized protein (TIGR02246 family)
MIAPAMLLDTYRQAAHAKDVDAFMSLYHPDVKVFDTWGTWAYDGAAAWRRAVEGWFGSLGTERVEVSFDEVSVTTGEALASLHAVATYAGVSADGKQLRAMQNRLTWVLQSVDGAWKVVHEHTSVPVSLDHAKAILQRP